MPLFRFHRGGLKESLATTIIVKTFTDLVKAIVMQDGFVNDANKNWPGRIKIEPYPAENNFDDRIGWYTHLVSANVYEKDVMCPIGYLSEPFDEDFEGWQERIHKEMILKEAGISL